MARQRTCVIEVEEQLDPASGKVTSSRVLFHAPFDQPFNERLKLNLSLRWDPGVKAWWGEWSGRTNMGKLGVLSRVSTVEFIEFAQSRQIALEWDEHIQKEGIIQLGTGTPTLYLWASYNNGADGFGRWGYKIDQADTVLAFMRDLATPTPRPGNPARTMPTSLPGAKTGPAPDDDIENDLTPGASDEEMEQEQDDAPLVGAYADPDTVAENSIVRGPIEPLFLAGVPKTLPEYRKGHTKPSGERTLFACQREAIGFAQQRIAYIAHERPGAKVVTLVAHDPGLGKTTVGITFAEKYPAYALDTVNPGAQFRPDRFGEIYRKPIMRVVVVCPERARSHWRNEFTLLSKRPVWRYGLDDQAGRNWADSRNGVLVVGWSSIIRKSFVDNLGNGNFEFDLLLIDEAHYMSNNKSQRSKAVREIGERVTHTMMLTGTPMLARPIQLYPLLNMANPQHFNSYWTYARRYCNAHRGKFGWVVTGKSNIPELAGHLGKVMHRVRKSKSGVPSRRIVVPIDIGERGDMEDAVAAAMGRLHLPAAWAEHMDATSENLEVTSDIRRIVYDARRDETIEWLADWARDAPGHKMLIFAWNKAVVADVVDGLTGALDLAPGQIVTVTGENSHKQREASVKAFGENGNVRWLVATIGALGDSVDGLQKKCSTGAFVQCDWTGKIMEQAEARLARVGQQFPVDWYYLVAADTVDERLVRVMVEKEDTVTEVIDGGAAPAGGGYNKVLEELLRWKAGYDGRHRAKRRRGAVAPIGEDA